MACDGTGYDQASRTHIQVQELKESLAFTNQVAKIAEDQGHHPVLITEWGIVSVTWWTHKIKGLHRNDFIMAAKTDQIYAETNRTD